MRRFTEVLLLAAYTPLLQVLSFANALEALLPTVNHDALRENGTIRGLLEARQTYYYCSAGWYRCQTVKCCYTGWSCCSNGGCCYPNYYCDRASNGKIGCCEDGKRCSGSVGDPHTIYPSYTTSYSTSTTTKRITTASTSTITTALVGRPTQSVGETIIEVSVLDVNINWSLDWVQGTSDCSPSVTSKSTSTENSTFTYIYSGSQSFHYYFNVVSYNAMWEVFINGVAHSTFFSEDSTNCTYSRMIGKTPASSTGAWTSQNFTVVLHGRDGIEPRYSGPWSFKLNQLLIQAPNASSTSTTRLGGLGNLTQTTRLPTATAFNASGRAQPYLPLLVYAGISLALLYCA